MPTMPPSIAPRSPIKSPPPRVQPPSVPAPTKTRRPISMVLYGPTGSGKTSAVSHFGKVGFVIDSQEQGIYYLRDRGLVPPPVYIEQFGNDAKSWKPLINRIRRAQFDDIDTLAVESLIGLQHICFRYHAKERFGTNEHPDGDITSGDKGFWSYQKGPKNAAEFDWPDLMEALNDVLASGKNVIVTGHSKEKQVVSAHGTVYQKNVPVVEKEIWDKISRWASIVAFLCCEVEQDKEKSRGLLKKVAKDTMNRRIYLSATPYAEAKNWWGLRKIIPAGDSGEECFKNFISEFS